MDNKQYDERLLEVLTYFESLDKPISFDLQEEQFGMSKHEFVSMVSDLIRNKWIKASIGCGFIQFLSLTFEGREKLEQLRVEQQNQRLLVRIGRWMLQNWHYLQAFLKSRFF